MKAFKEQLTYFMSLTAEEHNILLRAQTELYPDAVNSVMMADAIEVGQGRASPAPCPSKMDRR